ncbi:MULTISPECIES: hypothetical protein [Hyphomicrobiales]|jgi:death-on-curing protein|nr:MULTISPECIES: hypothetical protein [Phyllobacteriaceae]
MAHPVSAADNCELDLFLMGVAAVEIDEAGAAAFFRDHAVAIEG